MLGDQHSADPALVRTYTAKLLTSAALAGSERMRRFLRFVVDRTLSGAAAEVKEYLLGVEIFDRGQAFDPRIDPIVRVEARRLRSMLDAYYKGEGREDPVIIEIPRGTYVPSFHTRHLPDCETATVHTILVLPFTTLSADPEVEHFCNGLTDELVHSLTRTQGARVVVRNTALKFGDRENAIAGTRTRADVTMICNGSVRRSQGCLRILARLIDTASGCYMWSETYDRKMEGLMAIQEEVSRAIVVAWSTQVAESCRRACSVFSAAGNTQPRPYLVQSAPAPSFLH